MHSDRQASKFTKNLKTKLSLTWSIRIIIMSQRKSLGSAKPAHFVRGDAEVRRPLASPIQAGPSFLFPLHDNITRAMLEIIDQTVILYFHGNAVRRRRSSPQLLPVTDSASTRFTPLLPKAAEGSLDDENNYLGFLRRKKPQRIELIKL
jgi:hypothetical protein